MSYELILSTFSIILQLILVLIAWKALSAWKSELRGKEEHKLAKELLKYIKKLRFSIKTNSGSTYYVYLNDILIDGDNFYNNQIFLIKNEKVYFDESVWGLFSHMNIRSDVFLPENIRIILNDLQPSCMKNINHDKNQYTYIQIEGVKHLPVTVLDNEENNTINGIYDMYKEKNLCIEEYFKKWESLMKELNNS
jgi:hypothetical protein